MTKLCNECGVEKPLDQMVSGWNNKRNKRYYKAQCKPCRQSHRRGNPDEQRRNREYKQRIYADPEMRARILAQQRFSKYKVSPDDFCAMLAFQGGGCDICETKEPPGKGWCIDHDRSCCPGDRSCGECVRGILCTNCNVILGQAKDDPAVLAAAIEYLETNTRRTR